MAEGLFANAVRKRSDYQVSSAGVAAARGSKCSSDTGNLLKKHGIAMDHFTSRQVSENILAEATHVFAMTRGHLQTLERHFPKHADKFYLVGEFTGVPKKGANIDVPDPIGMGRAAYEEVGKLLEAAIPSMIAYIDGTSAKEE